MAEGETGGERGVRGLQRRCSHPRSIYVCMRECVHACLFEQEKECVFGVWARLVLVCVCVGVKGQGKRDGAKGEGHNALGEGDQICGARWGKCERSKCVWVL